MHSRTSGLSDYFAVGELDAIRIGRDIMTRLNWRKHGPPPGPAAPPTYDPDEILGIVSADVKVPFDPREILARVVDSSDFDEYKPLYGTSLVTGWACVHGYPVGVLANHRGVLFSEEAKKASEFILLANQTDTPLVFLQNTTGYMVGASYEQGGIIKDGAKMINAVTNSAVPHLTVNMASSFGAGNYGMSGRAYDPRFMFAWPGAKLAVMGAAQLAGVMSIVGRASAAATGRPFDEDADRARTAEIEAQIEAESHSFFVTGRLYDDGIIDPRDTRTVLGLTLSAVHSGPVAAGAASASSGCDASDTRDRQAAYRQPRRDRGQDLQDRAWPGHRHRGRVLRPGRRRPVRHARRRGGPAARGVAGRHLPSRRSHHRRGAGDRGRRRSSRLRFPLGKRGVRAGLRRRCAHLRRPGPGHDRRHGLQGRGQGDHGRRRRSRAARRHHHRRSRVRSRGSRRRGGPGRVPAAGQGGLRRRRARHATGPRPRRARRGSAQRARRGGVRVR